MTPKTTKRTFSTPARREGKLRSGKARKTASRANAIALFKTCVEGIADGDEEVWEQTHLIASLKFTEAGVGAVQSILGELPLLSPHADSVLAKTSKTPATTRTMLSNTQSDPRSIDSIRTFPLFERKWVDETQSFSMKKVVESLRPTDKKLEDLPSAYNWYPDAVPIDAIFPPGVPISAKEINAYYPHHARWKDVVHRLANNSYCGDDVIAMQAWFRGFDEPKIPPSEMNTFIRLSYRKKSSASKLKPTRNLYTDHLDPGKQVSDLRRGYVVPTFDDLLRGLKYIPTGLDARGLTQCLIWYLGVRDTFSPRLELNVLHAQSLLRALQIPLKPYGPQNLDKNALVEWKEKGEFTPQKVEDVERSDEKSIVKAEVLEKAKLEIGVKEEGVKLKVPVKTRHVLMLPMVLMIGLAGKGLEMGVEKAEARKLAREGSIGEATTDKDPFKAAEEPVKEIEEETPSGHRIPKRPLDERERTESPCKKRASVPTGPRTPTIPRMPSSRRAATPATALFGNWSASFNDRQEASYRSGSACPLTPGNSSTEPYARSRSRTYDRQLHYPASYRQLGSLRRFW